MAVTKARSSRGVENDRTVTARFLPHEADAARVRMHTSLDVEI